MTLTEAFAAAGFTLRNPRCDWSAMSDDGKKVALTVWSDEINKSRAPWSYGDIAAQKLAIWQNRAGNSVRKRHLRHVRNHCDGRAELVLVTAQDVTAEPRKVERARPWPERTGVLQEFDETTGEFRMDLIPTR
ncbi:MAG: hypothetical protein GDA53_06310 [Rhodobacteraceae bacterium]|nr:hypothetical protein [Paracoccaceae bacterium]